MNQVLNRVFMRETSEIDEVEEARERDRSALFVREDPKRSACPEPAERVDEEIGDCSRFAVAVPRVLGL